MLKKIVVIALIGLLSNLAVFAETKEEKAAKLAAKVKANVTKLGAGTDARIEVKLKDGTRISGYLSEIKESGFVVMNTTTANPVEVSYSQVKQVKGNNLSTGVKIAIAVGVILLIAAIVGLAQ